MKKFKILLIALVLIFGCVFYTQVQAVSLKAQENRPFSDDNSDGTVGNDTYRFLKGTAGLNRGYTIFKIYEEGDTAYSKVYYCLRGRVGFGATADTDVTTQAIEYTNIGEMHENSSAIISKYQEYYGVDPDVIETINGKEVNMYNAVLWILDNLYIPTDNNEGYIAEDYKQELLDKAGVEKDTAKREEITKDDLEVIQQLAIWYFTNYDQISDEISVSRDDMNPAYLLGLISNGNNETYDNNMFVGTRGANLNKIYQYLVNSAIQGSADYGTNEVRKITTQSTQFDKNIQLQIESIDYQETKPNVYHPEEYYYKIGPFKIGNTPRNTIDSSDIMIVDAEGTVVPRYYTFKDELTDTDTIYEIYYFVNGSDERIDTLQEGTEYYIKVKKLFTKGFKLGTNITALADYDMSEVTLKTSSVYSTNTANFFIRENVDQPVVEVNKKVIIEGDEITTQKPKEFDLSLRKFITSIRRNGQEIEIADRTPSIDLSKLNTTDERTGEKITTAIYTHPKNKLTVETNDTVIYTIRIYNEGELDGTALQVTDYLPTGLELVPASESEINTTYKWVAGEGNKITTDYLKDTTIKAYDSSKTTEGSGWQKAAIGDSGLYYADVQVECKVVAQVSAADQDLRNIAEITADNGDDRDSVPNNVNTGSYTPPADNSEYQEDDDDYEDLVLKAKNFDLSLRKFITKIERINDKTSEKEELPIASREPIIKIAGLKAGETTAKYVHPKNTISLKRGDIITYTIRVYNEGELDGYVLEVKDYLPDGLELVEGENAIWTVEGNALTTTSLKEQKLLGYNKDVTSVEDGVKWQKASDDESGLYYYDLKVVCRIKDDVADGAILKNVAEISSDKSEPTDIDDRDSVPGNVYEDDKHVPGAEVDGYTPGEQDDDDFEKVTVEPDQVFDLALRKYISSIKRNGEEVEFDDRTPSINTETLIKGTFDRNGELEYTATYEHSKEPLVVKQGDIITYTLRVYNEGELDGYATEIKDFIPEGLAFINYYNTNTENLWLLQGDVNSINLVGENGFYKTEEDVKNLKLDDFSVSGITSLKEVELVTGRASITTNQLNDELIKAFDKDKTELEEGWQKAESGEGGLYYKDVEVSFLVIAPNTCKDVLTNIAEISEDKDAEGKDVTDRDSIPDDKKDPYTESQEDDDDYEPVVLKYFDLALRKFITGVETNGKLTDVTSRIPQLSINEETGNIKYTHPKEESPVAVANNDIVIYTLRVYNEGTLAGYAEELTDDIPEGLEYLPEHNVNKEYEWVMIDKDGKVTENVSEAVKITTDYLSEAKEVVSKKVVTDEETGETIEAKIRENLIDPFDSSKGLSNTNPDYKDVKVAFKVIEENTSDRIIINSAQISKDSDDDEDSIPNEWNDPEDDQDKEYIYVKYFDLSLLKWVTKTIVTVDGKTTTTETGFKPNTGLTETTGIRDNKEEEPIAKVELDKKKLNKTTVKFAYKIRVTNEGEIAGYATEVTDFIPTGLEFKAEDNKKYGWVKEGENKVTTRALETVLLEPGESAELEIVFTWKNDANNLNLKTNIAETTEDYNDHNSKDIDSVPDNKEDPYEKEQEDDDDFALVILSIKTGKGATYTLLITAVITMLAGGIYLIKRYVLTY